MNQQSGVNLTDLISLIENNIEWHPEAEVDFKSLPSDEMRLDVLQQLARITIRPTVGQELEDKYGFNLKGYRKMYFWYSTHRIVYSIADSGKCRIWGIGHRDNFNIYRTVASRTKP